MGIISSNSDSEEKSPSSSPVIVDDHPTSSSSSLLSEPQIQSCSNTNLINSNNNIIVSKNANNSNNNISINNAIIKSNANSKLVGNQNGTTLVSGNVTTKPRLSFSIASILSKSQASLRKENEERGLGSKPLHYPFSAAFTSRGMPTCTTAATTTAAQLFHAGILASLPRKPTPWYPWVTSIHFRHSDRQ